MMTPTEIIRKAERLYLSFLRSWVRGDVFFPRILPVGQLPLSNYVQLRDGVQLLMARSKEQLGYGYTLAFDAHRPRKYEQQKLPKKVMIENESDFLRLIAKEQEFANFQLDVRLLSERQPSLHEWIVAHPQRIIDYHGSWPDLLEVCDYFVAHPRPQCYIRELPVRVHTKFIEQHAGILREVLERLLPEDLIQPDAATFARRFGLREDEPLVRVRFLDNQLFSRYALPLTDLSLPLSQFAQLDLQGERCIITENKMVFLTLPLLPHAFAILGGGFQVNTLSIITWLNSCPIFYWGDLDAHGFQILSNVRSAFPHVLSLMMDEPTLHSFSHFCVEGASYLAGELPYLSPQEQTLFQRLAKGNIRLEQERISHSYILQCLSECLKAPYG